MTVPDKAVGKRLDVPALHVTEAHRAKVLADVTLARWIAAGRRELDGLSPQARLALRVEDAIRRGRTLRWRESARVLEQSSAWWSSPDDNGDDWPA